MNTDEIKGEIIAALARPGWNTSIHTDTDDFRALKRAVENAKGDVLKVMALLCATQSWVANGPASDEMEAYIDTYVIKEQ